MRRCHLNLVIKNQYNNNNNNNNNNNKINNLFFLIIIIIIISLATNSVQRHILPCKAIKCKWITCCFKTAMPDYSFDVRKKNIKQKIRLNG